MRTIRSQRFQPADLAQVGDNPLHPGAARFYREQGFIGLALNITKASRVLF